MKHLSKALAFGLAAAAAFTACAAAATLALGSKTLSAGNAGVTACTSSLSATRNVDNSGNVTQVNVAGIPTACSGETLSVTLVGSGERCPRQRLRHRRQLRHELLRHDHELRRDRVRRERPRLQLRTDGSVSRCAVSVSRLAASPSCSPPPSASAPVSRTPRR